MDFSGVLFSAGVFLELKELKQLSDSEIDCST